MSNHLQRAALTATLALAVACGGCASPLGPAPARAGAYQKTSGAQALGGLVGTLLVESGAIKFLFFGPLLPPMAVLDVVLLPVTHDDPFPCTRAVVDQF